MRESTMDKRELAKRFRERFKQLVEGETQGLSGFLKEIGMDRSALSQFLDPKHDRLPRAETLRNIAIARGVSVDWLLSVENAQEGRQTLSTSNQIESETAEDGSSPLEQWRIEAEGHKIRYVPSSLPDMLDISNFSTDHTSHLQSGGAANEQVLSGLDLSDQDLEIAMPIQMVHSLAEQSGIWRDVPADVCRSQLEFMAETSASHYPSLRVHLFDGSKEFSAPFTVFGKIRAAVYIGDAYLVVTSNDQVRAFVKRFDHLVRQSVVNPSDVHLTFEKLARSIK